MSAIDAYLSYIIPAKTARSLARRLLKVAGIGYGGIVSHSGEIASIAQVLNSRKGSSSRLVFFDVGANIGAWSTAAKAAFPPAIIHAFEPSPAHLAKLQRATAAMDDIAVNAMALGAHEGVVTLYKDAEITGLASLTKRDLTHIDRQMSIEESVPITRLDSYCADHDIDHIDFLKIDVEGHELDVLRGAKTLLERGAIGAIQFEFGGCNIDTRTYMRDFLSLLNGFGLQLYVANPRGKLLRIDRYDEFLEQFGTTNYVAIKE